MTALVEEFSWILEKRATIPLHPLMELGGLGTLAAPHLVPSNSRIGRALHGHPGAIELTGLGLLAIPSALDLAKWYRHRRRAR